MYRLETYRPYEFDGWEWRGLVSEEDGAPVLERKEDGHSNEEHHGAKHV